MNSLVALLGRSIPIIIGGGLVQLIIYLLRRRGEVRQLDAANAKTDVDAQAVVVTSAAQSLALASQMRDEAHAQLAALREELDDRTAQAAALAQQVARLRVRLTKAEADVLILQAEVARLNQGSGG